jgi:hypothetical protein
MTDKLKQIIKDEFEKLPPETGEILRTFGWEQISEDIGKNHVLSEVELNDFQVETLLVLLGLEYSEDYSDNIENSIGLSKNEAKKIAEEVFQKIFIPINDLLVEKIKKSGQIRNQKWDKNLNFILSGGDYSSFVEPRQSKETLEETSKEAQQQNLEKTLGTKNKLVI